MSKPVIVIRKLEDSPEWLDRRLVAAYLATVYRVELAAAGAMEGGVVELYPGYGHSRYFARWLAKQNCDAYAIITACNPASVGLSAEKNVQKNKRLETDLRKVSRLLLPGLNLDPDSRWPPEESFFACRISAENVVRLGRKYGQNAIVWWEKGGAPELWWL